MRFNDIVADNFMSVGHAEFNFRNQGLILITGENKDDPSSASNGSGKSIYAEMVYYALYGKTLRNVKYADSIVNRRTKKDCRVEVNLDVSAGNLVIARYRKHKEFKNAIHVHLNGEPKHSTDVATTQRVINNLIGMDRDTFRRVVMQAQGMAYKYTDMSDRELKTFIETLTGCAVYSVAHEITNTRFIQEEGRAGALAEQSRFVQARQQELEGQVVQETARVASLEVDRTTGVAVLSENLKITAREMLALNALLADKDEEFRAVAAKEAEVVSEYEQKEKTHMQGLNRALDGVIQSREDTRTRESVAGAQDRAILSSIETERGKAEASVKQKHTDCLKQIDEVSQVYQVKLAEVAHERSKVLSELKNSSETMLREVQRINSLVVDSGLYNRKAKLTTEYKELVSYLKSIKDTQGSVCPQCGSLITEDAVKRKLSTSLPDSESRVQDAHKLLQKATLRLEEEETALAAEKAKVLLLERSVEALNNQAVSVGQAFDASAQQVEAQAERGREQLATAAAALLSTFGDITVEYAPKIQVAQDRLESTKQSYADKYAKLAISEKATRDKFNAELSSLLEQKQRATSSLVSTRLTLTQEVQQTKDSIHLIDTKRVRFENELAELKARNLKEKLAMLNLEKGALVERLADCAEDIWQSGILLSRYKYLLDAFGIGGIRSYMMDSILTYLNKRLAVYSHHLFDDTVRIELSPMRHNKNKTVTESITLVVTTPPDTSPYDTASGGERRKVDIALYLAFRDLNRLLSPVQVNVEVYDEILSFLDGESASRVIALLALDDSVETRILITHRTDVAILCDYTPISAIKSGGITTYVMP